MTSFKFISFLKEAGIVKTVSNECSSEDFIDVEEADMIYLEASSRSRNSTLGTIAPGSKS